MGKRSTPSATPRELVDSPKALAPRSTIRDLLSARLEIRLRPPPISRDRVHCSGDLADHLLSRVMGPTGFAWNTGHQADAPGRRRSSSFAEIATCEDVCPLIGVVGSNGGRW